jgi:uncharacterized alkaline shock family protein YloU
MNQLPDIPASGTAATGDGPQAGRIITEPVVAVIAAHAAARTPGVVRLEPGVSGVLREITRVARRWAGLTGPTPVDGVQVRFDDDAVGIHLDLVVTADRQVAATAAAAQRAVTEAVTASTGISAPVVSVSVLDIDISTRSPLAE